MEENLPRSESMGHVEFGGWYLTHAIWRNSHGSYQPETGVRKRAEDGTYSDFHLAQHDCDNWPLVTMFLLAGLSKGWAVDRIASLIDWLHQRMRRIARRARVRLA